MQTVTFNSGVKLDVYWINPINGGAGGYMLETAEAPFAMLAEVLENASAMVWTDEEGQQHKGVYANIRHITRSYNRIQIILNKGEPA